MNGTIKIELYSENVKVIWNDYEDFIDLENEILSKYHSALAVHIGQELRLLTWQIRRKEEKSVRLIAS